MLVLGCVRILSLQGLLFGANGYTCFGCSWVISIFLCVSVTSLLGNIELKTLTLNNQGFGAHMETLAETQEIWGLIAPKKRVTSDVSCYSDVNKERCIGNSYSPII